MIKQDNEINALFKLHDYRSALYINCVNLLNENGFTQISNYVFSRARHRQHTKRFFCVYQHGTALALNIYYPQESMSIDSIDSMQKQVDSFAYEIMRQDMSTMP